MVLLPSIAMAVAPSVVEQIQVFAMLIVALFVVIGGPVLYRSLHFKVGNIEAKLDKTEKQLNGRDDADTTVSSDVSQIHTNVKALTNTMAAQRTLIDDIHANILIGGAERAAISAAVEGHTASLSQLKVDVGVLTHRVGVVEAREV